MISKYEKSAILDFTQKALIRALWTFAQTMAGGITVGMTVSEVNWGYLFSISFVAAIASLLKSIVVGIPEKSMTTCDMGAFYIDNDTGKCVFDLSQVNLDDVKDKKIVQLMVVPTKLQPGENVNPSV